MRADLHAHSTVSDGTDEPERVMDLAADAGVEVIALTDHDATEGWSRAQAQAAKHGLVFVPGCEVSTLFSGVSVHILAYGLDPEHPAMRDLLAANRHQRLSRAQRMVNNLAKDLPITWADVEARHPGQKIVVRPHIADTLVTLGLCGTRQEAFDRWLADGSPYVVEHDSPDVFVAVSAIREAGGLPVLAHGWAPKRRKAGVTDHLPALVDAGLAGIEVYHPEHGPREREVALHSAQSLGLLTTGGSDFHGMSKPQSIGAATIQGEELARFLQALADAA